MKPPASKFSAIILAGGEGKRVGGKDKGLLPYKDKTLIEAVIHTIFPQVDELIISANRNHNTYQKLCGSVATKVVPDTTTHYLGPLAGIASCLPHCQYQYVLIVACDTPILPDNLIEKLFQNIETKSVAIAAVDGRHQLALLIKKSLLPSLQTAIHNQQLKLIEWVKSQDYCMVSFDEKSNAFLNLNSLEKQMND